jgi:hypothetical protein
MIYAVWLEYKKKKPLSTVRGDIKKVIIALYYIFLFALSH